MLGSICFFQTLAGGLGGFLAGYIFDVKGYYQLAFIVLAIVSLIGLFSTMLVRPLKRKMSTGLLKAQ
jgi:hypothetical protein